jgi:DNA-binding GntR family transcriptional regulator
VGKVRAHLDQMGAAAKGGDWATVVDLDLGFHELLVEAAGSRRLSRMFATILAETRLCLSRLDARYTAREELVDEHVTLFDLLTSRDLDAFLAALADHFQIAVAALAPDA